MTALRRTATALTLLLAAIIAGRAGAEPAPVCIGDCGDDGLVTVDEVIRGVRLALGEPDDGCLSSFDRNRNGRADVDELVTGIRNELAGCPGPPVPLVLDFDFGEGALGWTAGFADYPEGEEDFYELQEGIRPLPDELGTSATGFFLSGNNHSDDLFMFLKKRLGPEDGIIAGRTYDVSFEIRFASNAPTGCIGVGGAPGESVYLKAGASDIEPLAVPGAEFLVMNVDKGNQAIGGADASLVGNIANGIACGPEVPYVSLLRNHAHPFPVTANDAGELWLIVGTDSGFEATTALYYEAVEVSLTPADETGRDR